MTTRPRQGDSLTTSPANADWWITLVTNKTVRLISAIAALGALIWPIVNYVFPDVPWHATALQVGDKIAGAFSSNCDKLNRYRIAEKQGDALATDAVASFYQLGVCVPQNDSTAFALYKKAADGQDSWAMLELGAYYLNGSIGPNPDYKMALKYLQLAQDDNVARAYTLIGTMYENGLIPDEKANGQQALALYEQGLEHGDQRAAALIGSLYATGRKGIEKDCSKAVDYYSKGVALDDDRSQTLMGDIYDKGCGPFKQDPIAAMAWYKKGAEAGDPRAGTLILSHGGSWPDRDRALQRAVIESMIFLGGLALTLAGSFLLITKIRHKREQLLAGQRQR